ncbi:MAG: hypothetical protein RLP09_09020 [Sandaracinaceae bacterium]
MTVDRRALRVVPAALLHQLERGEDRRERVAQLVAQQREELVLALVGDLQLLLHALALDRDGRGPVEHLHDLPLVRRRGARLVVVDGERPEHAAVRGPDGRGPARAEAVREREVREVDPERVGRDVLDQHLAVVVRGGPAGADRGPDRHAVNGLVVGAREAGRRAVSQRPRLAVEEQHRAPEPPQGVTLDGADQAVQGRRELRPARDLLERHALVGEDRGRALRLRAGGVRLLLAAPHLPVEARVVEGDRRVGGQRDRQPLVAVREAVGLRVREHQAAEHIAVAALDRHREHAGGPGQRALGRAKDPPPADGLEDRLVGPDGVHQRLGSGAGHAPRVVAADEGAGVGVGQRHRLVGDALKQPALVELLREGDGDPVHGVAEPLLLEPLALGDVLGGPEHAERPPRLVALDAAEGLLHADRAVRAPDAQLDGVVLVALERLPQRLLDAGSVLLEDPGEERLVARLEGLRVLAVLAKDLARPGDLPRRDLPLPAADPRQALRVGELRLGALAGGDVLHRGEPPLFLAPVTEDRRDQELHVDAGAVLSAEAQLEALGGRVAGDGAGEGGLDAPALLGGPVREGRRGPEQLLRVEAEHAAEGGVDVPLHAVGVDHREASLGGPLDGREHRARRRARRAVIARHSFAACKGLVRPASPRSPPGPGILPGWRGSLRSTAS